jgi:uncharacterized membrane protein YcaP (DUF421 family)
MAIQPSVQVEFSTEGGYMPEIWPAIESAIGLDANSHDLTVWQMGLRAVVVYLIALVILRLGDKRFFGRSTAFDVILAVIFGSIVSRAITGQSAFFPTLGAAIIVVLTHWLLAVAAFYSHPFAYLIKGHSRVLVKDGQIDWHAMSRSHIGKNDLLTAIRANGHVTTLEEVQEARLERNGNISVIKKK